MEELRQRWFDELEDYKDAMSSDRFRWMKNLMKDDDYVDISKALVINGYLIALRDCGKNIGDLREILLEIIGMIDYRIEVEN